MVGKTRSVFTLVQRLGFFWRHRDSGRLSEFLEGFDEERVRDAARHHMLVLTQLLDGRYSAYGLRMVEALGIKSLEEVWGYRGYLVERFDLVIPQNYPKKVWLEAENPNSYELSMLVKEFARKLDSRKYRIAGVVVAGPVQEYVPEGAAKRKD